MSRSAGQVIVVGGGVIGATCAYYLARTGRSVVLIDRGLFGSGCSHGNCGLVVPSHILPLAVPGAVSVALRSLFTPNSAFRIKPRFDLRLWPWLYHFSRRCNMHDMLESGRAIQALLTSSRQLYDELMRDEPLDCEWQTAGLLFVLQTPAGLAHYAETDRMVAEHFGLAGERLEGDDLVKREPALRRGLAGGFYYSRDAQLRPDRLMASWKNVLAARGIPIHENRRVRGFVRENDRVRAVLTDQGELPAEVVIVATGAWTPLLEKELGCRIPIQPGKGYSITMARPARCPSVPLIFEEHRVVATPHRTGYRLGSMMEFAGYDASLKPRRLALLREGARHYLHEPYGEPVEEEWFGWRPMTYDSKPILGRSPMLENVFIAAGHNMLGLSMAPATGKLIVELIDGQTPHIDPAPYAATRF